MSIFRLFKKERTNWICVEKALPEVQFGNDAGMSLLYLVTDGEAYSIGYYDHIRNVWVCCVPGFDVMMPVNGILYWMNLPEIPQNNKPKRPRSDYKNMMANLYFSLPKIN